MDTNTFPTRKTNQHVILKSRLRFLMSFNSGRKQLMALCKNYVSKVALNLFTMWICLKQSMT
jgi:hypothetical protein